MWNVAKAHNALIVHLRKNLLIGRCYLQEGVREGSGKETRMLIGGEEPACWSLSEKPAGRNASFVHKPLNGTATRLDQFGYFRRGLLVPQLVVLGSRPLHRGDDRPQNAPAHGRDDLRHPDGKQLQD